MTFYDVNLEFTKKRFLTDWAEALRRREGQGWGGYTLGLLKGEHLSF